MPSGRLWTWGSDPDAFLAASGTPKALDCPASRGKSSQNNVENWQSLNKIEHGPFPNHIGHICAEPKSQGRFVRAKFMWGNVQCQNVHRQYYTHATLLCISESTSLFFLDSRRAHEQGRLTLPQFSTRFPRFLEDRTVSKGKRSFEPRIRDTYEKKKVGRAGWRFLFPLKCFNQKNMLSSQAGCCIIHLPGSYPLRVNSINPLPELPRRTI